MKIIDVHTHAFPDFLAEKAITALSENAYATPYHNGTIAGLLESMDKSNVYQSWIQSIATKPDQAENILNWSLEIASDRIVPFISVHPEDKNFRNILDKAKDNNIKGVKLHPHYQDFFIDDEKVFPFYEAILKKGFIILFHAGKDDGFPGKDNASAVRIKKVIKNFAGEKIILGHFGAYKEWDEVFHNIAGENIYIETSFVLKLQGESIFKKIIEKHSHDKILFGTDSPWSNVAEDVQLLQHTTLPQELKEKIFYKNALLLLNF